MNDFRFYFIRAIRVIRLRSNFSGRPFNNAERWGGADQGNDRPNQSFRPNIALPNDRSDPLPNMGNSAAFGPPGCVGGANNAPRVGMVMQNNITENTTRGRIGGGMRPNLLLENRTAQSIRAKHPDGNDCEIIVVAKHLTYVFPYHLRTNYCIYDL